MVSYPGAIVISPDGNNVYVAASTARKRHDRRVRARPQDGTLSQLCPHDCIAENSDALRLPPTPTLTAEGPSCHRGQPRRSATSMSPTRPGTRSPTFSRAGDGSLSQPDERCITEHGLRQRRVQRLGTGLDNVDAVVSARRRQRLHGHTEQQTARRSRSPSSAQLRTDRWPLAGRTTASRRRTARATALRRPARDQGRHIGGGQPRRPECLQLAPAATGDRRVRARSRAGRWRSSTGNNCIEEVRTAECDTQGTGLDGADEVKVSPDGDNVYVATQRGRLL